MPYETHGLRHDTEALFAKLLAEDKWLMTPCVVFQPHSTFLPQVLLVRTLEDLLTFSDDDAQVICGWPGKHRQDVFEFTVGEFRSAVAGRDHRGGEQPMTSCDEKQAGEADVPTVEATEGEAAQMAKSLVAYMGVLKARRPSRELSCAFTHAEEALMWLERIAPTVAEEQAAEPAERPEDLSEG